MLKRFTKLFAASLVMTLLLTQTAFAATYKVVPGDSLYRIGTYFHTTASTIANMNNLSSDLIYPGQVFNVPTVYTVKSGDTLYFIALRNGITLDSLRQANNKWDSMIYPGQTLAIPMKSSTTNANTTVANTSTNSSSSAGSTSSTGGTSAVVSYTSSDQDLLSRLIMAEAGGEPYDAQVAVGAVVLNRVQDSRFPSTISGVIYQKTDGYYQFTPVENGWINKPASDSAKKAANEALNGVDPTNGALFYFDTSATNSWLWSQPIAARIGKMVFTYLK